MAAGADTGRGELARVDDWREQQRRRDLARREEVMRLPVLPVREHGAIGGRDGDVRVCTSVGPAGEVVAVWTTAEGADAVNARTVSAGGASFPDTGTGRPVTALITVHNPGLTAVIEVRELTLAHIMVQPMPGDRFLVAGARCRWHPDGPEPNAVLYDAGGHAVSGHVLGDGIGELLATSSGQVWVGYFDEGIYGNYGWATPTPNNRSASTGSSASPPRWSPTGVFPGTPRSGRGNRSATAPP